MNIIIAAAATTATATATASYTTDPVNHAQMTVCALTQVGFERPAPMFMSKKPR
jgi:hypothetical protein